MESESFKLLKTVLIFITIVVFVLVAAVFVRKAYVNKYSQPTYQMK